MSMCGSCKDAADGVVVAVKEYVTPASDSQPVSLQRVVVGPAEHACEYPVSCTCQHKPPQIWKP